jgi:hypothetical protein
MGFYSMWTGPRGAHETPTERRRNISIFRLGIINYFGDMAKVVL